jgi:hypothetical protein
MSRPASKQAGNGRFPSARDGEVVSLNGDGDLFLVDSRFAVSGTHTSMLLSMLAPIVHIQNKSDQAALR